jgi:hypothetical protein
VTQPPADGPPPGVGPVVEEKKREAEREEFFAEPEDRRLRDVRSRERGLVDEEGEGVPFVHPGPDPVRSGGGGGGGTVTTTSDGQVITQQPAEEQQKTPWGLILGVGGGLLGLALLMKSGGDGRSEARASR